MICIYDRVIIRPFVPLFLCPVIVEKMVDRGSLPSDVLFPGELTKVRIDFEAQDGSRTHIFGDPDGAVTLSNCSRVNLGCLSKTVGEGQHRLQLSWSTKGPGGSSQEGCLLRKCRAARLPQGNQQTVLPGRSTSAASR
jgi:hypothetical protein